MKYNPDKHHRRSIRLKGYDYSQPGAYFITICTQNKECLFGHIKDGKMILNNSGKWVDQHFVQLPQKFTNMQIDEYIVMPNHFHGIIIINPVGAIHELPNNKLQNKQNTINPVGAIHELPNNKLQNKQNTINPVGAIHELPLHELPQTKSSKHHQSSSDKLNRRQMLLPKIIGYFKMNTAKQINEIRKSPGIPIWQRNYYEHIIRNDNELKRIRKYITSNPINWKADENYVD